MHIVYLCETGHVILDTHTLAVIVTLVAAIHGSSSQHDQEYIMECDIRELQDIRGLNVCQPQLQVVISNKHTLFYLCL